MPNPAAAIDAVPASASAGDGDVRAAVDALNERAYELRYADAAEAVRLAGEARERAEGAGYARGVAYALRASGVARCLRFELDAATAELEEARRLFAELGDERGRASALNWLGNAAWRLADYPAALRLQLEALQVQRAAGDRAGESDSLNFIGNVHYHIGEYARALEHYQQAARIKEEIGDLRGLSQCVNNVGNIHAQLGDYRQALQFHRRALELKRGAADRQGEAISLVNVGSGHEALGEYDRALEFYHAALDRAREVGDRYVEADALRDVGDVHRKLGDPGRALECYRAALEVARGAGARMVEAEVLIGIGRALAGPDDGGRAVEALGEALAVAEEVRSRRLIYEAHHALSEAHEARGELAEALRHFKAFHAAEEAVFSAESERRIQGILATAEIERTQREAELLRGKNEELTEANRALREADEEKARLLAQLREQAEELDRLSRVDALTGLFNRRHVDERLALEWERARRFGRDLTVVLADLDHFKQVNDRFSHAAGDAVLREVGRIFREGTRHVDVVGRYGGEELVLLLVETPPEKAAGCCEKLRAAVEAHDWSAIHPELRVTVSMGLAGNHAVESPEALVAAADAWLYEAKREGRNRVCR
jgi:diguanylate cyclase (GGDEF)-like protein